MSNYNWAPVEGYKPFPVYKPVLGGEHKWSITGATTVGTWVGCEDDEHRIYSDGNSYRHGGAYGRKDLTEGRDVPATHILYEASAAKQYRPTARVRALCNKHAGVEKRLITQGKSPYVRVILKAEPEVIAKQLTFERTELVEAAQDAFEVEQRAITKARFDYIAENRVARILDADTAMSRSYDGAAKVTIDTDEYGASRVKLGWNYTLSIPDARHIGQALLDAAAVAHDKNEKALCG